MFSLKKRGLLPVLVLTLAAGLQAAPKLRLVSTTVGPVSVNTGASPAQQTVEAYNAGDGSLGLAVSTSANWLTAALGAPRPCSLREGQCTPINISFNTASQARGTYTGFVTVSDPNALDAPQTISVTVNVGGAIPDSVNLYVAPNGSADQLRFTTNSLLRSTANTQSGGPWLSLALEGSGSFRFQFPYRIQAQHLEGMAEGTYNGTLAVIDSAVTQENKTVNVTLRVTSQPIARPSQSLVGFKMAAGAAKQTVPVLISNGGLGDLTVSGVTATTASGGNWLTAETAPNGIVNVSADVNGVAAGSYRGTVTVNSNAANGALAIPVNLEVVAAGPPQGVYGGVLNSANFDDGFAPGSVVAIFGEQFTNAAPVSATAVPLQTTLGGVRVLVNDVAAPVFFSSYNQVNFQIPYETVPGEAIVRVEREGTRGNPLAINVNARAPRIIQVGNYGVIVNQDGSLPMPGGRPARPGQVITIYAVGLGATSPAVGTGEGAPAAEPLARVTSPPRVILGNAFQGAEVLQPIFVGLTPGLVGLYQVNVILPAETPTGDVFISLEGDDYRSNVVLLQIQE
ncbi:MAG: hypothetical protein JNK87_22295 [Bryobacterales bacterium]|nr:hypothetical protein [Bryobacterales bacterium]